MIFFRCCTVSIQDLPISCQLRSPNGSVSVYRPNTDFSVLPQLRFIWAQTQRIITVLPAWALGFDCSEWVGNGWRGGPSVIQDMSWIPQYLSGVRWHGNIVWGGSDWFRIAWPEQRGLMGIVWLLDHRIKPVVSSVVMPTWMEEKRGKSNEKWHTELKDGGSHHK